MSLKTINKYSSDSLSSLKTSGEGNHADFRKAYSIRLWEAVMTNQVSKAMSKWWGSSKATFTFITRGMTQSLKHRREKR